MANIAHVTLGEILEKRFLQLPEKNEGFRAIEVIGVENHGDCSYPYFMMGTRHGFGQNGLRTVNMMHWNFYYR